MLGIAGGSSPLSCCTETATTLTRSHPPAGALQAANGERRGEQTGVVRVARTRTLRGGHGLAATLEILPPKESKGLFGARWLRADPLVSGGRGRGGGRESGEVNRKGSGETRREGGEGEEGGERGQ